MIAIIILIALGTKFHQLAQEFNKSSWMYVLSGVAVFYGVQILFGVAYAFFDESAPEISSSTELVLNLVGLMIGGIAALIYYKYLHKKFQEEKSINDGDVLDDGFLLP